MAGIEHIVVGVDGSDSSKNALEWAYEEAAHHGASLLVVTTWHPPSLPMSPPFGSVPPEDYGDQPRQEALALLERFTSELVPKDPAVDVRTSIEEGKNAARALIEQSKDADLVVVGARGHGGFVGMLLGSVSQHLVAHADCPVVVVRGDRPLQSSRVS
jgi:nucleotide-binding universal stress UspA family protein